MSLNPFDFDKYMIQKQFFRLGAFHIYNSVGALALYVDKKVFKLREDIRVYTDESKSIEVLTIKARRILDFSSAYDVWDSRTGEKVGVFKRRGWQSMVQDAWIIMDANDNDIGEITEDSMLMALLRRLATNLIPQSFHGTIQGIPVLSFHQHFNPFILKMDLDFSMDINKLMDRRLGLAAAVLFTAVEGRQES